MAKYQKQSLPVEIPTDADFQWIAGFLEGEGSFCPMSGTDKRARVGANQKEPEPLEKLLRFLGGRIYLTNRTRSYDGKPCHDYVWMLRGEPAREFLIKLRPFMSKRRQCQIDKTLGGYFSLEHGTPERTIQRSQVRAQANIVALRKAG
jgi:hypothetical protein